MTRDEGRASLALRSIAIWCWESGGGLAHDPRARVVSSFVQPVLFLFVLGYGMSTLVGATAGFFLFNAGSSRRSDGVLVPLTGPDPQRAVDRAHPDLPVSDGTGPDGLGDGVRYRRRLLVLDDDVDTELG